MNRKGDWKVENKSTLERHLFQLENKLLLPEIRTSKEEVMNLLSDNFFEFGSSGQVLYKDEDISEATFGIVKMTMSDFEIHSLSEEIVLATYRIYNELNNQHSLRSSIWKVVDGQWKMHFHQGTKIPL